MSKVRPVQQLTPEQSKAVQKFLSAKPNWQETQTTFPPHVLPTNFFSFSLDPFPKLVHDVAWIWNQTNSKISVTPECGGELILQKLNARKRRGYPKAPSYKVWQYTFEQTDSEPNKLYGIWCEKGADESTESNVLNSTEKRLMHGSAPFSSDSIVNIPSLQQVKEFNLAEAQIQLKKRERSSLDTHQEAPPTKFRKPVPLGPPVIPGLAGPPDSVHGGLPISSSSPNIILNGIPGTNGPPNQVAPKLELNSLSSQPLAPASNTPSSQFPFFSPQTQTPIMHPYRPMPWQRQTPSPPQFKPNGQLAYKFSPKSEH